MAFEFNTYQPLRFYENLEQQNRYKDDYKAKVFELLSPRSYVLPFQIKRDSLPLPLTSVKLVNVDTGLETELINDFEFGQLKIYPFENYDIIVHFGTEELDSPIDEGKYYYTVSDGVNIWFSEVVTVKGFDPLDLTANECKLTKIEYFDSCDVGGIYYRTEFNTTPQYKNIIYLDVETGKPEYEYNEEGDENARGEFVPELKKLVKQYALQVVLPEYMVDALQLIPLHGNIEITNNFGYTGSVDTINVESKWEGKKGVYATTDIVFSTDFILKVGCCDALEQPINGCIFVPPLNQVVALLVEGSADYNNFEYTTPNNETVELVEDDYVFIEDTGGIVTRKQYGISEMETLPQENNIVSGGGFRGWSVDAGLISGFSYIKVKYEPLDLNELPTEMRCVVKDDGGTILADVTIPVTNPLLATYTAFFSFPQITDITRKRIEFISDGIFTTKGNGSAPYTVVNKTQYTTNGDLLNPNWTDTSGAIDSYMTKVFFDAEGYSSPFQLLSLGDTYQNLNDNGLNADYRYWGGSNSIGFLQIPTIDSLVFDNGENKFKIQGDTFSSAGVRIKAGFPVISDTIIGYGLGSDYINNGLFIDIPNGTTKIKIEAIGASGCEVAESAWYDINPAAIGSGIVGLTLQVT